MLHMFPSQFLYARIIHVVDHPGRSHVEDLSPSEYRVRRTDAAALQVAWKYILFSSRVIYVEETYGTIRCTKMKLCQCVIAHCSVLSESRETTMNVIE
jgi:hypothetical protein